MALLGQLFKGLRHGLQVSNLCLQPGHMGQGHGLDVDTAAIRIAPQNQQLGDLPDRKAKVTRAANETQVLHIL